MYRKRVRAAACRMAMLLAATLFLGGCQKPSQGDENQMLSAVGEEDGPVREYPVPEWETFMYELTGTDRNTAQNPPVLCRSSVSQMVLTQGETPSEFQTHMLVFSLDAGKWTAIRMNEGFERDGVEYGWIGRTIPAMDGNQYCLAYLEAGRARLAAFGADGVGEIYADREITDQKQGDLTLLDASGNLIICKNNGYQYDSEGAYFADVYFYNDKLEEQSQLKLTGWVLGGAQAEGQSPFYLYGYDEEKRPCLWEADDSKRLLEGMKELDYHTAYAEGGVLYLTDRNGIWEMGEEGIRELYHYADYGYYPDTIYGMCRGEGQTLQILMECQGEMLVLIYDLTKKDVVIDKQELILALGIRNVGLEEVIARFNRQSSQYRVTVVYPEREEDRENFCRKIQMELASGKGPDLLGDDVFPDLAAVVDSGYLECLDGQGYEKLGCIDTALEANRIEQKLYGIPYDFSLDMAVYRVSDVAGEESLTMEELMEKVRSSQAEVLQDLLYPVHIVLKYALSDSSNKTYVDWEAGESHLDEEPFLELLEFAREYGYQGGTVNGSEIFAAPTFFYYNPGISQVSDLTYIYELLGTTDIAVLGYPRQEGYGIYLDTRSIYMNSQSQGKTGAEEFLKYLLSEEAQTIYASHDTWEELHSAGGFLAANYANFPVNEAALKTLMDRELGENPDSQWIEGNYSASSHAEIQRDQFHFMMENARPAFDLGELNDIVQEELAPFFDGVRTAQEVAQILDSRVQLYLDERGQ